jgi:hypothetical protein
MEPLTQLFAVVGAVYASDCLCWAPRSSLALRALRSGNFRRARPSTLLGNSDAGWVWAQPLPPLGTVLFSAAWPISVSPDAVATREPLELEPSARRAFRARALRWSEIESVTSAERELLVNGERFASCGSARLARELASRLDEWRDLEARARAKSIDDALAAAFDETQVLARVEQHLRGTKRLRWLCIALLAWLGVVCPPALYFHGGDVAWAIVLAGLLSLHAATLWQLDRAFRAHLPDCVQERRRALLAMCLSPMGAIRALDELSRPLLAELHPVAAAVLLPHSDRADIVRAALVELRHPRVVEDPDRAVVEVEHWFRARLEPQLRSAAVRLGVDVDALLAPPASEGDDLRGFCPRCLRQFTRDAGLCFDCTVPLEPFFRAPPSSGAAPAGR